MTAVHFPGGVIKRTGFSAAELAAHRELQPVQEALLHAGWKSAVGASGTILAVGEVLRAQAWSSGGITLRGLKRLRKALLDAGHVNKLKFAGLSTDRAPVFAGGVAILIALFETFGLKKISISEGALREGLLYDLLGRIRHEDVRERTIQALCARYQIEDAQAQRVGDTALRSLDAVMKSWNLKADSYRNLLGWAARHAPLLLVLEDVHTADVPSLELAAYAARRIGGLRVMMLITRRELPHSAEADRRGAELLRSSWLPQASLSPGSVVRSWPC